MREGAGEPEKEGGGDMIGAAYRCMITQELQDLLFVKVGRLKRRAIHLKL
jgi:hypothetical protein